MARSIKDALLQAGVIRPEDTEESRRERERLARREREAREVAEKLADPRLPPRWEPPAAGRIVSGAAEETRPRTAICASCGEPFDPDAAENRRAGKSDECASCAAEDGDAGPQRKRGQMVWTHKTAPTLEIEGGKKLTPGEIAAMRRR